MEEEVKSCSLCDRPRKYKSLCDMHYSREYRKTEKGKLATKRYNEGRGAEYLIEYKKNNPEKFKRKGRVKPVTKYCQCGSPVISKGLCKKCYAKSRYVPTGGKKGRKKRDYNILLKEVLIKVSEGLSVKESCKALKTTDCSLYGNITKTQREEIDRFVIINRSASFLYR